MYAPRRFALFCVLRGALRFVLYTTLLIKKKKKVQDSNANIIIYIGYQLLGQLFEVTNQVGTWADLWWVVIYLFIFISNNPILLKA
jgi:hypothetical protein